MPLPNLKHLFSFNILRKHLDYWILSIVLLFCYFTSPAIYSPDSSSYFGIVIHRYPVYTIWIRLWEFLFGASYQNIIVILQLAFGLFTIVPLARAIIRIFNLPNWIHFLILIVLIYPYFPPLWVGHNLTSEGLAYPLYLVTIQYAIQFLFLKRQQSLWYLAGVIVLLCLTRGQFIVMPIIILMVYVLRERKHLFKKKIVLIPIVLLLFTPVAVQLIDSSYHKLLHGHFVTTPYSFVAIVTMPLYVSQLSDSTDIPDPSVRKIFIDSYKTIDSLGLVSAAIEGSSAERYQVFHDNFPKICNQNIHTKARNLYLKQGFEPWENTIKAEEACKALTPVLIKNNLKEYLAVYWQGILTGFRSVIILIVLLVIAMYGTICFIRKPDLESTMIALSGAFIFSNAIIVGIACHSIERYLFYNYVLALLMIILFLRKMNTQYVG